MPSEEIYTIDKHNGYMPSEYMHEERNGHQTKGGKTT